MSVREDTERDKGVDTDLFVTFLVDIKKKKGAFKSLFSKATGGRRRGIKRATCGPGATGC